MNIDAYQGQEMPGHIKTLFNIFFSEEPLNHIQQDQIQLPNLEIPTFLLCFV